MTNDSPTYVRQMADQMEHDAAHVHGALVRQDLRVAARLLRSYADLLELVEAWKKP